MNQHDLITYSTLIDKQDVKSLSFNKHDVLEHETEKSLRAKKLFNAMRLGNGPDHGKVTIIFDTTDGIHRVETTIWAATDISVQLKADTHIPVSSIIDVIY